MTDVLDTALGALATLLGNLSGIAVSYTYAPEALASLPAAVVYPFKGSASWDGGVSHELHTIVAEVFVARGDLSVADAVARPYIGLVNAALGNNPTITNTVSCVLECRYTYGQMNYGADQLLGVRFEIDIKLRRII